MSHPLRRGPQAVSGLPAGSASTGYLQGTFHVGTLVSSKATLIVNLAGHSVNVVEPRHQPCLLDYHVSSITQAELDELCDRFRVPRVISMRALKMGEVLQQARWELGEITFPTVALEYEVRLLLAPFIRRLLSEFLLHPLQVSLAL